MSNNNSGKVELKEKLAAIEHERWSDWQKWVHSVCEPQVNAVTGIKTGLLIPQELVDRWSRQATTSYEKLSDQEKASDMEQVDRYWSLVEAYISTKVNGKVIKELVELYDKRELVRIDQNTSVVFIRANDVKDRIRTLKELPEVEQSIK